MRSLLSIDPQTLAAVTGGNNDNGNPGACDAATARIHDLPSAPPGPPLIADPKRPDLTGSGPRSGPRFE